MLNFYLLGVLFVFILMFIKMASGIAASNSIRARNFKKIDLHYNFFTGTFSKGKQKSLSVILSLFLMLIIEPLLSWVNIAITLWKWFSTYVNRTALPESVKEFQYKLGHVILTKEEIERMGRELANKQGIQLTDDEGDDNSITEDDEGFFYQHTVFPNKFQYTYYYHSPDYDNESNAIYEYRISEFKVESRLIECYRSHLPHNDKSRQYEVKDNVVLESEIRERDKINKPLLTKTDEHIDQLKHQIEWEELSYYKLKYFILSKHPDTINKQDFRKYIRSELERIKMGFTSISDIAESNGYSIKKFEVGGFAPAIPKDLPEIEIEKSKEKYKAIFTGSLYETNGISEYEFNNADDIKEYLMSLLGDSNN